MVTPNCCGHKRSQATVTVTVTGAPASHTMGESSAGTERNYGLRL